MTAIPVWVIYVVMICLCVLMFLVVGLFVALIITARKAHQLMLFAQNNILPHAGMMADKLNNIASTTELLVDKIDHQAMLALPRVESIVARVDHASELMEAGTVKVTQTLEETQQGFERIKSDPLTPKVLAGLGGVAAAGLVVKAIGSFRGRKRKSAPREQQ